MANALYTRLQATANRLIKSFGQAGVVTRITPPDPVLGGDPVPTPYPATLVPMAYEARYIDGTVILAGDMQIYISSVGLAIEPTVGDVVTANGTDYAIVNGDPNKYDGVISFFSFGGQLLWGLRWYRRRITWFEKIWTNLE